MPAGQWRTKFTHPAGSNGNSGETRDTPFIDIGVAFTNLRAIWGTYRGALKIGPGDYLTEDWPIIKVDAHVFLDGWGTGPLDDPGQNVGVLIQRPDTAASNGQPFMMPIPIGEITPGPREIWEHHTHAEGFVLDGHMDGTPTFLTTPAAGWEVSHGGMNCYCRDVGFVNFEDAAIRGLYGGLETFGLFRGYVIDGAILDLVNDADPFSGSRYMHGIWVSGVNHSNLTGPDSTPAYTFREYNADMTSPGSAITVVGGKTEGSRHFWENTGGQASNNFGSKVTCIGVSGSVTAATPGNARIIREFKQASGLGDSNHWNFIHSVPINPGTEFYESDHEGAPLTYGSGGPEATEEIAEFLMLPGWAAPKVEHKGTG